MPAARYLLAPSGLPSHAVSIHHSANHSHSHLRNTTPACTSHTHSTQGDFGSEPFIFGGGFDLGVPSTRGGAITMTKFSFSGPASTGYDVGQGSTNSVLLGPIPLLDDVEVYSAN